jgi:hypothetical protein
MKRILVEEKHDKDVDLNLVKSKEKLDNKLKLEKSLKLSERRYRKLESIQNQDPNALNMPNDEFEEVKQKFKSGEVDYDEDISDQYNTISSLVHRQQDEEDKENDPQPSFWNKLLNVFGFGSEDSKTVEATNNDDRLIQSRKLIRCFSKIELSELQAVESFYFGPMVSLPNENFKAAIKKTYYFKLFDALSRYCEV